MECVLREDRRICRSFGYEFQTSKRYRRLVKRRRNRWMRAQGKARIKEQQEAPSRE